MVSLPPLLKSVFSNIFKRPATVKYPFQRLEPPEGFRGRHEVDWAKCIGCGTCARDCPAFAIEIVNTAQGPRTSIDLAKCIFCYQCADSCPRGAISSTKVFELATWRRESLVIRPPQA
ncbi:MAG: NADH-quinone oxidoreductase subunit I [Candidatus Nezhaarchaeota archaeon]|nr:NADH-quinone oxidoreductase subunit I [Candidatus Nezhaarchaeota archaeon]